MYACKERNKIKDPEETYSVRRADLQIIIHLRLMGYSGCLLCCSDNPLLSQIHRHTSGQKHLFPSALEYWWLVAYIQLSVSSSGPQKNAALPKSFLGITCIGKRSGQGLKDTASPPQLEASAAGLSQLPDSLGNWPRPLLWLHCSLCQLASFTSSLVFIPRDSPVSSLHADLRLRVCILGNLACSVVNG